MKIPKFNVKIAAGLGMLTFLVVPVISSADYISSIVGTTCMVPIFNTNFMMPPQGGQIVKIDGQMYFWKSYLPECANAVQQQATTFFGANTGTQYSAPVYVQPTYSQPIYSQPVYNQPIYNQPSYYNPPVYTQPIQQPQPHTVCSTQYY